MNRKIALKWARALESGLYKQTEGTLRNPEGFCCLGVLCNLHAQAHPKIARREMDVDTYLGADTNLPQEVMEWAGIDGDGGDFTNENGFIKVNITKDEYSGEENYDTARNLIELNDELGFNFAEIASVIRKHSKH